MYENAMQQRACAPIGALAAKVADAPVRDRGQLEIAADSIANGLSELGVALEGLEDRLRPVLQPELPRPETAGGNQATQPPISPAVGYLQDQRRRIEHLLMRVSRIQSLLDV